jgi:hypothetical protein
MQNVVICKVTWKGTLRQLFILLRPLPTYPPPGTHCTYVKYIYIFPQGRGGGGSVEPERREEGQQGTDQKDGS